MCCSLVGTEGTSVKCSHKQLATTQKEVQRSYFMRYQQQIEVSSATSWTFASAGLTFVRTLERSTSVLDPLYGDHLKQVIPEGGNFIVMPWFRMTSLVTMTMPMTR
jgi:hypothetical protein